MPSSEQPGPERRGVAGRCTAVLAAVGALVLLLGAVSALLEFRRPGEPDGVWRLVAELFRLTNADGEGNLWSWFSALVLTVLAAGLALKALARTRPTGSRPYVFLSVVALVMAIDEAAQLHEALALVGGYFFREAAAVTFAWVIPGIVVLGVTGALALWLSRTIDGRLRRLLIVAGVLFMSGAIGVEAWGGSLVLDGTGSPSARYGLVMIEESLEFAGALVAVWAVWSTVTLRTSRDRAVEFIDVTRDRLRA